MIRYLDVCSGYSAFTLANEGLNYECVGYAEIDAFPAAVLGARYGATRPRYMPDPDAPDIDAKERKARLALGKSMRSLSDRHFGNRVVNFGDFTQIKADDIAGPVHLLIGGTPCQAFSMAGKRLGLDDPRGNLTLEFLALARRVRAQWVAWENVPGVLSHDEGRTMGTFLRLMGELGYGWAYRVLDAQYVRVDGLARAVPQRRQRVFVVGHLGDAAGPAAVLFDRESLRGDPAPRREAGQGVARPLAACPPGGSGYRNDADTADNLIAGTLSANGKAAGSATQQDAEAGLLVTHSLRADGFDASEDGTGRGTPLVPVAFNTTQLTSKQNRQRLVPDGPCHNLSALDHPPAVAFQTRGSNIDLGQEVAGTIGLNADRASGGAPCLAFPANLSATQYAAAENLSPSLGALNPTAVAFTCKDSGQDAGVIAPTMRSMGHGDSHANGGGQLAVAFSLRGREGEAQAEPAPDGLAPSLRTMGGGSSHAFLAERWAVRRLTPRECERLMGVPDDFTLIEYRGKPAADGPRYKALGNSQARNVMRWIAWGMRDVMAVRDAA